MKKSKLFTYVFGIFMTETIGALSGFLSRNGMKLYSETAVKPPLTPPDAVFPIVWFVLYALMGIGAARIFLTPSSADRTRGLTLFLIQLTVNFFWSILFFGLQSYGLAFFWLLLLWILVLWMIIVFNRVDKPAAVLQLPYLLWLTFAACLNAGAWILNR